MKHDITPALAGVFIKKAATLGYEVREYNGEVDKKRCLTAFRGQEEVCQFERSGSMRFYPENPLVQERNELHNLLCSMKQAHDLYADAKPLEGVGVEGFRLVSEFGNYLLATQMGKDDEVRFVTWQYTYDREGVTWGHYYETNVEGAKTDFIIRAGLVEENRIFSKEELKTLYESCVYRGRNDERITYSDEKQLQSVMERLEDALPEIGQVQGQNREPEPGQGDGYGL